jgi:hypothetical protein
MWTWIGCIWHTLSSLLAWRSMNSHTWCHLKCHVCLRSRKWACYMERVVVRPYVRSFITNRSLHEPRDQIFVADVMVTDPMWKTVASSVISWRAGAGVKLSAITNIHKYKGLHEGHHFIPTAMEVHDTLV